MTRRELLPTLRAIERATGRAAALARMGHFGTARALLVKAEVELAACVRYLRGVRAVRPLRVSEPDPSAPPFPPFLVIRKGM